MTVILLANVGNRDVQVPAHPELPPTKEARALGQVLLDNWDAYRDAIQTDILIKALRWVVRKHGGVDRVILVASDQTDERYRQTDTITIAQVIERLLLEHRGSFEWAKAIGEVTIETLTANPASYDEMTLFYDRLLPTIPVRHGDMVYLAVSGGTAAMAAMLLFKGIEHFQAQAHPLYVNEYDAMPTSLNVGRRIMLNALVSDIRLSIGAYQYHAALRLVEENADFLRQTIRNFDMLCAVIRYARARLNFDFTEAENALFGTDLDAQPEFARALHDLVNDITESNRTEAWLLREVLHTAEISFRTGAYADFLGRAFRLSEGLTDAVLDRWAPADLFVTVSVQNSDGSSSSRKRLSEAWLTEHIDAWEFLEQRKINLEIGLTRKTLLTLAEYFAGSNNSRRQVVKYLNRIDELGSYRNQMPFAHGYAGVSLEMLKARYKTNRDDEMLRNLVWLYEQCVGQAPGPNPYDAINDLILGLLQADA